MSTLTGKQDLTILESEKDLQGYFQRFSKKTEDRKVGLEAEFFALDRASGRALSYEGPSGIEAVLRNLAQNHSYEMLLENQHVIGLRKNGILISLEPGGQVELSAPPVKYVRDVEALLDHFVLELASVSRAFPNILWISNGIQPVSSLEEISWVPKTRYRLMADYLKDRGTLSHYMMKTTATNQLNFDYTSESDAMELFRLAMFLSPMISALCANSSISSGAPNGFLTRRVQIWRETDPERTGILAEFTRPGKTFQDYLDYLLEMPMIFIVRGDEWIFVKNMRFREFIRSGYQGHRATLSDFELHLSTAFPEVRFKQYMEIRGMDAQPLPLIPAMTAFWKGIFYDLKSRREALDLVAGVSPQQLMDFYANVPKLGLQAKLAGREMLPIIKQLVLISKSGLKNLSQRGGVDESCYLERIESAFFIDGKTHAEKMLQKWDSAYLRDAAQLARDLDLH